MLLFYRLRRIVRSLFCYRVFLFCFDIYLCYGRRLDGCFSYFTGGLIGNYGMILSNVFNDLVDLSFYDFDLGIAYDIARAISSIDLNIRSNARQVVCGHRHRNRQSSLLYSKLQSSLVQCRYGDWLLKRGVLPGVAFSLDYDKLSMQDLLDLYVFPSDFVLDSFGFKPVEGPVFADFRNGSLVGICIRNVATDLDYVASAKFTISNYGWFLFGYDLYQPDDEVFIVEGVFDALMMRKNNFNAIAVSAACPSSVQMACLISKFNNLKLCLDNDFWGKVGSYTIAKCLGLPIFFTGLKDAGSYVDGPIVLHQMDLTQLFEHLAVEIPKYNCLSDRTRHLPYNH